MEIRTLVSKLVDDDFFQSLANNPLVQFGPRTERFLGATIFPEKLVKKNQYSEGTVQYKTIVANAATRYSAPQMKSGSYIGKAYVELANSDAASEFTAEDYDALFDIIDYLPDAAPLKEVPIEAMAKVTEWADNTIVKPLLVFNEKCRWQALGDAVVQLRGDNGYREDVLYSAPTGHRVNAGGTWSNSSYDPFNDIDAGIQKLKDKEYTAKRMITSTKNLRLMLKNPNVRQRLGLQVLLPNTIVGIKVNSQLNQLNAYLQDNNYPLIEIYDAKYNTQVARLRYTPEDYFYILATTGKDVQLDTDEGQLTLPDTLGYVGVGRAANRSTPGRPVVVEYNDKKAAPVTGEAWQVSLPVCLTLKVCTLSRISANK